MENNSIDRYRKKTIFTFIKEISQTPQGLIACILFVLLYSSAIFAPFFAPYAPNDIVSDNIYHPPNVRLWSNELGFRLQVQEYALINNFNKNICTNKRQV